VASRALAGQGSHHALHPHEARTFDEHRLAFDACHELFDAAEMTSAGAERLDRVPRRFPQPQQGRYAVGEASLNAVDAFGPGARHFEDIDALRDAARAWLEAAETPLSRSKPADAPAANRRRAATPGS